MVTCGVTVAILGGLNFFVFAGTLIVPVDPDTDEDVGEKEDPIECHEAVEWGHLRSI